MSLLMHILIFQIIEAQLLGSDECDVHFKLGAVLLAFKSGLHYCQGESQPGVDLAHPAMSNLCV